MKEPRAEYMLSAEKTKELETEASARYLALVKSMRHVFAQAQAVT